MKKKSKKISDGLPVINPHAAGIDIGDTEHYVAYYDADGMLKVETFGTFTQDLEAIVRLLKNNNITSVAMEATGIYYVALFLMLEENGIEPVLVNAKHVKNVTGRKADDTDAAWIQKLHSCGLLKKSFQPNGEDRVLRDYVRNRKKLITLNSDSIRRMQKALEMMNIKIHTVISDLAGKTGMKMVNAILNGERDPKKLADLREPGIHAKEEVIIKSLQGIWKSHLLFLLQQAFEEYEFRIRQIKACEEKISKQLIQMIAKINDGDISGTHEITPQKKITKPAKNQFNSPIQPLLKSLIGVDLCEIPGVKEVTVLEIIAETGTDMTKWETSKHFAAWLNLAPNTKKTGGKEISTQMMKKKNMAGKTIRAAGAALSRNKSFLGGYYRKIRSRIGGKGAVVATAHKLSRIIYTMIKHKTEFNPERHQGDQQKIKTQMIRNLENRLAKLKMAS